jgi:hypothetical protein
MVDPDIFWAPRDALVQQLPETRPYQKVPSASNPGHFEHRPSSRFAMPQRQDVLRLSTSFQLAIDALWRDLAGRRRADNAGLCGRVGPRTDRALAKSQRYRQSLLSWFSRRRNPLQSRREKGLS